MKTQTCQFVEATEVFKGHPLAWELFLDSNPNCTWGDNNRSMVSPDVVIDALEDSEPDAGDQEKQVGQVVERLKKIPEGVYVDLEN
jgi:hypothetical protein